MNSVSEHGNVLVIEHCGILLRGPSGSGKSSLTLGLIEEAQRQGLKAVLVCDDRVVFGKKSGRLVANVPDEIAGKIEIRGYGITERPFAKSADVSLVVELVPDEKIKRMPGDDLASIEGINLPLLKVPIRHEEAATRIVFAWLRDKVNIGNDPLQIGEETYSGKPDPSELRT